MSLGGRFYHFCPFCPGHDSLRQVAAADLHKWEERTPATDSATCTDPSLPYELLWDSPPGSMVVTGHKLFIRSWDLYVMGFVTE